MPIDTWSFFVLVLSGFLTVWTYKKVNGSSKPLTDFEYLGFSAFWGLILIFFYVFNVKNNQILEIAFANPFAFGLTLSVIGIIFAVVIGVGIRSLKNQWKKGNWANKLGKK